MNWNCLSGDQIIDYVDCGASDTDIEAHLNYCPSCSLELRILREARPAFYPDIEVPEYLIDRVISPLRKEPS